jgi:hypothetical protein
LTKIVNFNNLYVKFTLLLVNYCLLYRKIDKIMKTRFLLPARCKPIGLILAIPAFILMISYLHFGFTFKFLNYNTISKSGFIISNDNFTDEIGGVVLIIGLLMVAFAKEKEEDERITKLRLESLVWAVYVNSFFLILAILFFYNEQFLQIMAYNICTPLILFIARFNLVMARERNHLKKEGL